MRIILIGFGRFPGAPFNPSAILAKTLARHRRPALAEAVRAVHIFATSYAAVDRDLPKLFAAEPDIVLMFGLAGRRRQLCIETRARNALSTLFPDADGYRPQHGVIAAGGPTELRSHAPCAALLGTLRGSPCPSRLSRDAGRYLCNYAYWRALQRVDRGRPLVQFVHIPPLRSRRRRQQPGRSHPSFGSLVAAAESLLIALMAASRR